MENERFPRGIVSVNLDCEKDVPVTIDERRAVPSPFYIAPPTYWKFSATIEAKSREDAIAILRMYLETQ